MIPQFKSLADFINMGGYGGFVWAAWGLAYCTIFGLLIFGFSQLNKWQKRTEKLETLIKGDE